MFRRGITPVVAVVLLLMMTVAAAGGAYAWMQQVQDEAQNRAGDELRTALSVKDVECRGNMIDLSISNTGETEVLTDDATVYLYADGNLLDTVNHDYSGAGFGTPGGFGEIRAVFDTGMVHRGYNVEVSFPEITVKAQCDAKPILNSTYPIYAGWNPNPTSVCGSTRMMGGYDNFGTGDASSATLPDLDAGTYNVSFHYFFVDSWDSGEQGFLYWNGNQEWVHDRVIGGADLCGGSWDDENGTDTPEYNVVVDHPGGDATLLFNSSLDQGPTDESWGVTNVTVLRQQ